MADPCCKPSQIDSSACCQPAEIDRRSFLRMAGVGTLAAATPPPVMAGPFAPQDFDANIPADKRLNPAWVKSLFERGAPEVYRGEELKSIAMPIGGVGAGHVYLSGEGRLAEFRVDGHNGGSNVIPIEQGFALRTVSPAGIETRQLAHHDVPNLTFRGEYPIARIRYPGAVIDTTLEAFTPFVPLDAETSGHPATIFQFTLANTSSHPVEATLLGALENGLCSIARYTPGTRRNNVLRSPAVTVLHSTVTPQPPSPTAPPRAEVIFEDWSNPDFTGWTVEGDAFGSGPVPRATMEKKWRNIGGQGAGIAHSYFPSQSDKPTGKLTSAPFIIDRAYINLWISGGDHRDTTYVRLFVEGEPPQTAVGKNGNALAINVFDTRHVQGKRAHLEIADLATGDWGNIGVGRITFADTPGDGAPADQQPDYGSLALALVGPEPAIAYAKGSLAFDAQPSNEASAPIQDHLTGALARTVHLKPGQSATVTFVIAWHFPNLTMNRLGKVGRFYTNRFPDAAAVATHIATHLDQLASTTRLWRDTWYDSTLPIWFLDRTLLNVSTLATSGCYRFADGRFYAWEGGAGCCDGTCTHVWQYAHSMSRLFPSLERDTRERVDLKIALHPDTGVMGFRAEFDMNLAVDGQAGTILRIYREHQMSPDNAFLQRNWATIKKVYDPLFALDADEDGIMEGAQMNTLDRPWFGQISWMSSMYVAALRAGEQMATELGDPAFATRCRAIAEKGTANITSRLYNGEYFINIVDPAHLNTVNSGTGSHIDQVYGQSWAFQVGLPRVLPENETRSALRALWKYNFTPDAGAYFAAHKAGRKFVSVGDAGMIICTFPHPDWDYSKASGGPGNGFAYYFNETWTGNEYQVATHMFWEGMLLEPMAIVRAIHDRYHPIKRNPYSEFECGSHYARAMASHGAFLGLCGFEHHAPLGHIAFAPRITPENFRAPFTAAEGWGTYAQTIQPRGMNATIEIKHGQLKLKTMALAWPAAPNKPAVKATVGGKRIRALCSVKEGRIAVQFPAEITIPTGVKLALAIT